MATIKDEIKNKYKNLNICLKKIIRCLYNKETTKLKDCIEFSKDFNDLTQIINKNKNNNLTLLNSLEGKTGIYIFLDKKNIPVYIGVGGISKNLKTSSGNNPQDLKARVAQELKYYSKKDCNYSKDSGATLSKNIQKIESILQDKKVTPDESISNYISNANSGLSSLFFLV